jgi:YVTN family beta-propeller protein
LWLLAGLMVLTLAASTSVAHACVPQNASELGYIPNFGGTTISVVNLVNDKVVGTIGGFTRPITVEVAPDGSQLYVDDWPAETSIGVGAVRIVDACTGRIVKSISVGVPGGPVPIGPTSNLSADGKTLWTDVLAAGPVYRIDTATGTIVRTYPAPGNLITQISPDQKVLYVANATAFLETVNTATGQAYGSLIPTGLMPAWMSVTPDGSRLIAGDFGDGMLTVINTATRSVVATVKMGLTSAPEYGGVSPNGATYWSLNGDGTVWVIDTNTGKVLHIINNRYLTLGVAFNPSGSLAYVSSLAENPRQGSPLAVNPLISTELLFYPSLFTSPGLLNVYDTSTYKLLAQIPLPGPTPTFISTARGPFPAPAGCPAASGRLDGLALGPIRLGLTRTQARSKFTSVSTRGRRDMDFFCLNLSGIRVGYPSAKLLHRLSPARRRRITGRVVLALTANPYYALRGMRAGAQLATTARRLRVGPGFRIGLNQWYLFPNGASRGVLKVRHGVIDEIGIANKQLTDDRHAALTFMTSFS